MLNFGLDRMRIVAPPRYGWPSPQAVALASGERRVLDAAQIYENMQGAVADCDYVDGATAWGRELTKPVFAPEAAMDDARALAGKRVAVMLGPERAGLENDDITRVFAFITVPVNPEIPNPNLAQRSLLLGYEWLRQTAPASAVVHHMARTQWGRDRGVGRSL